MANRSTRKRSSQGTAPVELIRELYDSAANTRNWSYSPYSGHKVGAAIRTRSGRVYSGCNVENSSYGATVCAERVAIQSAIAAEGRIEIEEILVITDATPPWPPCGMCRQVIAEFALGTTVVHAANLKGEIESRTLSKIFPEAFTPAHMARSPRGKKSEKRRVRRS